MVANGCTRGTLMRLTPRPTAQGGIDSMSSETEVVSEMVSEGESARARATRRCLDIHHRSAATVVETRDRDGKKTVGRYFIRSSHLNSSPVVLLNQHIRPHAEKCHACMSFYLLECGCIKCCMLCERHLGVIEDGGWVLGRQHCIPDVRTRDNQV